MSGLGNSPFTSPNFAFLMQYDEVFIRHAALAKRYVFDDPNSTLIKLRQFGELLAQHAAAYAGIAVEEHASQHELIDKLWDRQIINAQAHLSATASEALSTICAAKAIRGAVKHVLKSVVREIRMLRAVGAGGG
jgi:hypothetical protein